MLHFLVGFFLLLFCLTQVNPCNERETLEEWIALSWVLFRVTDLTEPGLDQHERAHFSQERYPADLSPTPCSAIIRTTAAIVLMSLEHLIMNISYQYNLSL